MEDERPKYKKKTSYIRYDVAKRKIEAARNQSPKKMVDIEIKDKKFTINSSLKKNLDFMKKEIKNDWDFIILVDGMERSGKTTLVSQCAYYLAGGDFSLKNNYCFTARQFEEKIKNAKKNDVIVYDEAVTGLDIKDTMTKIAKGLKKLVAQIGYKNLYIFVILPSFFDFQKYWAIHRSDLLINIYTVKQDGHLKRGKFRAYSRTNKKYLYINGKQFYDYNVQSFDFDGNFNSFFPFEKKEYDKIKNEAVTDAPGDEGDPVGMHISHKIALINIIRYIALKEKLLNLKELSKIGGLHYNTVYRLSKQKFLKNRRGRVIGTIDDEKFKEER